MSRKTIGNRICSRDNRQKSLLRASSVEFPRFIAERKRVSGSGCGIDIAAAQASAPLLWGAGAELAVSRDGDGAGWPEAGGGEQGITAKGSARRLWRSAGRTPGAIFVGPVARAHLRGGSAQMQRVRRAGAPGCVHHRAGEGAADTVMCSRPNNCTGNRTSTLTTGGGECTAADPSEAVEVIPELEFDQTTANLAAEAGQDQHTHPAGAYVQPNMSWSLIRFWVGNPAM